MATTHVNHAQEVPVPVHAYEDVHKDASSSSSSSTIPIIDLHLILSASAPTIAQQEEMEKLRCALVSWGFFQAIGHGISNSLLDDLRNVSTEFFELPLEEKRKYAMVYNGKQEVMQGYGNDKILLEGHSFDRSDRLILLLKPQQQRELNFWPEYPKQFREVLNEYSIKTALLADNIVKVMAKVLGLEEDCFLKQFGEQALHARFNYYSQGSKLKPHSDANGITILLQDKEVEGLQVLKHGEWIKVPTIPHALVVNVGDQIEIMSNGEYKSVVHRVIPDSEKNRISIAVFYQACFDNEIGPADRLIDETRPRLFKNIKGKEYMKIFMEKFLKGKRAIDHVKV